MNIYYAPPEQIRSGFAELSGQEAKHASRVMRAREGDRLVVVDGAGGRYEGTIVRIFDNTVQVQVEDYRQLAEPNPQLVLGMGIIKKRERLEFAVEKAVELGARHIVLFRSEHTIKKNVRVNRLKSVALSAMKQSLHAWLPEILMAQSVQQVMEQFSDARCLMAHEKVGKEEASDLFRDNAEQLLLLVGPEGGFSSAEVDRAVESGAELVSLGNRRLRAETAVVALLSQFLNQ